jgi:hypothetical protein
MMRPIVDIANVNGDTRQSKAAPRQEQAGQHKDQNAGNHQHSPFIRCPGGQNPPPW